ncbi:BQ2448_5977 [Microbotryum intermedium]|uniref:BQ2448_5977 protein n=1 Tax=Microbotryum intermedium TaxID=269621 RepID=A0A238F5T8_9BASI|nr:BQ2448_5977 [Microbotryum intermedium]
MRRSFRVLSRSRSILLDRAPTPPDAPVSTRSRPRRGPAHPVLPKYDEKDEAQTNVDLSILASPLRRDLLTRKVLPKDLMIQFKLIQTETTPSSLHITPTSLLHPRFSDPHPGRSVYTLCWTDAVRLLSEKQTYKRLSPQSVLPLSPTLQRIESSLARRIHQEIVLLNKRLVSVPVDEAREVGLDKVVRRMKGQEWIRGGSNVVQEQDGWGLKAMLNLWTTETWKEQGPKEWFGSLPPPPNDMGTTPTIPVYTLGDYFKHVHLPPLSYEAGKIALDANEGKHVTLNDLIVAQLDELLSTFEKRGLSKVEREALWVQSQTQGKEGRRSHVGGVYGFYGPSTRSEADRQTVPLLKALWRLGLWYGKGWK